MTEFEFHLSEYVLRAALCKFWNDRPTDQPDLDRDQAKLIEIMRLARLGAAVEAMPIDILLSRSNENEWDIYRFVDGSNTAVNNIGYGNSASEAIQLHTNKA